MQFVASTIILAYLTGRSEFMLYVEVTEGSLTSELYREMFPKLSIISNIIDCAVA